MLKGGEMPCHDLDHPRPRHRPVRPALRGLVHLEPVLIVGGLRALIMQALHPCGCPKLCTQPVTCCLVADGSAA